MIDLQERLLPAIDGGAAVVEQANWLVRVAQRLQRTPQLGGLLALFGADVEGRGRRGLREAVALEDRHADAAEEVAEALAERRAAGDGTEAAATQRGASPSSACW